MGEHQGKSILDPVNFTESKHEKGHYWPLPCTHRESTCTATSNKLVYIGFLVGKVPVQVLLGVHSAPRAT